MPREFGQDSQQFSAARGNVKVSSPEAAVAQSLSIKVDHVVDYGATWDEQDTSALLLQADSVQALPDAWSPAYQSESRESSMTVATFNLLNTVVGGGALSLPYAFSKSGWLCGIIIVAFSAQLSLFALNLLCTLARKLSCDSYAAVVRKTMGRGSADLLDLIQFFMLLLVVVAFLILIRDIAGDIFEFAVLGSASASASDADGTPSLSPQQRTGLLCAIAAAMFPLMAQESLHALRHVSIVGSASVLLLLVVIAHKAVLANTHGGQDFFAAVVAGGPRGRARAWPVDVDGVLDALPIILIAFLCQFNVVSVYASLSRPSAERASRVLQRLTTAAGCLYAAFGLCGYFFATDRTADNILSNFSSRDPALVAARSGLVFTLMCQTPMVMLPCRQALLALLGKLGEGCCCLSFGARGGAAGAGARLLPGSGSPPPASAFPPVAATGTAPGSAGAYTPVPASAAAAAPVSGSGSGSGAGAGSNALARVTATLLLLVLSLSLAIAAPGVAAIWAVAGSSLSLILAFLFPALAYLSLWFQLSAARRRVDWECLGAWGLLAVSVAMIGLCSAQAWANLGGWEGLAGAAAAMLPGAGEAGAGKGVADVPAPHPSKSPRWL